VAAPEPAAEPAATPTPAPAAEAAQVPATGQRMLSAIIGDPDSEENIRKLVNELAIKFPGRRFTLAKADTGQRVEHVECQIVRTPIAA
jgi:hypothetical protein